MIVEVGNYTNAQIRDALSIAIRELGFGSRKDLPTPHDFSYGVWEEVHLRLAEPLKTENHAAYLCLYENKRRA